MPQEVRETLGSPVLTDMWKLAMGWEALAGYGTHQYAETSSGQETFVFYSPHHIQVQLHLPFSAATNRCTQPMGGAARNLVNMISLKARKSRVESVF